METLKQIIAKNPLFFAFLFPALTDGFITLIGQDATYWTNKTVNEASPAYYVLLLSPWLFLLGCLVWFIFWYQLFKKLKEPFNLFFMFLFIAGHSWGSSTWIWKIMRVNHLYVIGNQPTVMFAWAIDITYFATIALCASYCLKIYLYRNGGAKHSKTR